MDIGYLILMAVVFAAIGFFMLRYESLKERILVWLYLLSGGLALYSVETADAGQPLHLTALIALLLCLSPTMVDGLLALNKTANSPKRKSFIPTAENYGQGQ